MQSLSGLSKDIANFLSVAFPSQMARLWKNLALEGLPKGEGNWEWCERMWARCYHHSQSCGITIVLSMTIPRIMDLVSSLAASWWTAACTSWILPMFCFWVYHYKVLYWGVFWNWCTSESYRTWIIDTIYVDGFANAIINVQF